MARRSVKDGYHEGLAVVCFSHVLRIRAASQSFGLVVEPGRWSEGAHAGRQPNRDLLRYPAANFPMRRLTLLLPILAWSCSKAEPTPPTPPPTPTPAAAAKNVVDKAKEALNNIKEGASTPLDNKSLTQLVAVVKDLQAELAESQAAGGGKPDLKTMMAKAKDLKGIAEKNGLKLSELTGVVARLTTVMGALRAGDVPEALQADVKALEKHKELKALFQQ